MLAGSSILLTGGTGSFGHAFVPMTLNRYNPRRLVIYSRGEMQQWEMAKTYGHDSRVRFFIGDVRDRERLYRALDGVDFVVHAAAAKIVPTAEYNPFECVKTNVMGAMNLIDACIDKGVKRVVALSTDKASSRSICTARPSSFPISCSSPEIRMSELTKPVSRPSGTAM